MFSPDDIADGPKWTSEFFILKKCKPKECNTGDMQRKDGLGVVTEESLPLGCICKEDDGPPCGYMEGDILFNNTTRSDTVSASAILHISLSLLQSCQSGRTTRQGRFVYTLRALAGA